MTTERALTTLDIFKIAQQHKDDPCAFARAIEQAVLQSPEIQALRKDAERYRCLRDIAEPSDWEYIGHQSPEVIDVEIDELLREQS